MLEEEREEQRELAVFAESGLVKLKETKLGLERLRIALNYMRKTEIPLVHAHKRIRMKA